MRLLALSLVLACGVAHADSTVAPPPAPWQTRCAVRLEAARVKLAKDVPDFESVAVYVGPVLYGGDPPPVGAASVEVALRVSHGDFFQAVIYDRGAAGAATAWRAAKVENDRQLNLARARGRLAAYLTVWTQSKDALRHFRAALQPALDDCLK